MNIYARFFDHDTLVGSVEELLEFLGSIPDIKLTEELEADVRNYVAGDMPYPKRYKIRPRVYFILIKTTAASMEEFKANRKEKAPAPVDTDSLNPKEFKATLLQEVRRGWYRGNITFKRVLQIPGTGKFQYQDTKFEAIMVADSGLECYSRIVQHLKTRDDVDMRSQFPSAKGANFSFKYLGMELKTGTSNAQEYEVAEESDSNQANSAKVLEKVESGDEQKESTAKQDSEAEAISNEPTLFPELSEDKASDEAAIKEDTQSES